MKPPPCHVATTALIPEKTSRVTMALVPGAPPWPWLAYQATMVWVTGCGFHAPLNVQMISGWRGSVTSAKTGMDVPCMTNTASWAVDDDEHVAVIAAHEGTEAGLATGLGVEDGRVDGDADGLGDGVGLGLATGDGVGLVWAVEPPGPQPSSASSAAIATTPSLTGA
jgi:hypothetical protein